MINELASTLLQEWPSSFVRDITYYFATAIVVWFVLWHIIRQPAVRYKIRNDTPPYKQLLSEIVHSVRSVAIFTTIGMLPLGLIHSGYLPWYELNDQLRGLGWFLTGFVLIVVSHDTYFYWLHRIIHRPPYFKKWHRRHHKSHNPSPFAAYSFDLREAFGMGAFTVLWIVLVPTPSYVIEAFILHHIVRNTIGHAGYEFMPATRNGKPRFDFLTTSLHHDLHHSYAGTNYGLYFTWWDRIMGTEDPGYLEHFRMLVIKRGSLRNRRTT